MQREYKNKAISEKPATPEQLFFFPKHDPPIAVYAKDQEEAQKILAELDAKK